MYLLLMINYIFISSTAFALNDNNFNAGCRVNIINNLPQTNQPLYLERFDNINSLNLIIPNTNGEIVLQQFQELILACPGNNNGFKNVYLRSKMLTAHCDSGLRFKISNKDQQLHDITCILPVESEIQSTDIACGPMGDGNIIAIGYNVKPYFVRVFEVCYDATKTHSWYSQHVVVSSQHVVQRMDRPYFSTKGIKNYRNLVQAYRRVTQQHRFKKLFPNANYVNDESFVSRGHLTPSRDFPFNYLQNATFYYLNVLPQWQQVNGGNWNEVEYITRQLSVRLRRNLHVFTGGFGHLEQFNAINQPMYLDTNEQIPIPKYFWKVVIDPISQRGVVFIILNNPFVQTNYNQFNFCTNVCADVRIKSHFYELFQKPQLGLVTCCTIKEFQQIVKYLPHFQTIDNVLHF